MCLAEWNKVDFITKTSKPHPAHEELCKAIYVLGQASDDHAERPYLLYLYPNYNHMRQTRVHALLSQLLHPLHCHQLAGLFRAQWPTSTSSSQPTAS